MESEDESEESEESEPSSGTEVSTDSEFAREEPAAPPAILVTEAPPPLPPPPPPPVPLSRTRSAGGLATKRALELKRKYLLGEPSPPAVRKSDSTSQLDTKLQAFKTNITEFQKMLHPAPSPPTPPVVSAFQVTTDLAKKPMPDIIKNLCEVAPVDLLKLDCKKEWREEPITEEKTPENETDSISEDSSHTETGPEQPVPRVEVHDEGGELIQMDSLMIIPEPTDTQPPPADTAAVAESESSESCRNATTLALTETELSDWATESAVMDDFDEHREDRKRSKNPRTLSGPKTVHDAKNLSSISSHVCGRSSPPQCVHYSNALEHFEFADEGEQDPTIGSPITHKNEGYMELVDEDYIVYSPVNDRSMNFIERSFSETYFKPSQDTESTSITPVPSADIKSLHFDDMTRSTDSESTITRLERPIVPELKSPQLLVTIESSESEKSISKPTSPVVEICTTSSTIGSPITTLSSTRGTFSSLKSPSSSSKSITSTSTDTKEPSSLNSPSLIKELDTIVKADREMAIVISKASASEISPPLADTPVRNTFAAPTPFTMYSPAICRSASAQFPRSLSPDSTTTNKVQELKREREEQTDIVRKLVLERLGQAPRRSARRCRVSPASGVPPPVPPPPELPPPAEAPPPRPALPLPVMPSLSDPELARDRRRKSIIRSLSSYLNRRLGPKTKVCHHTSSNCKRVDVKNR